MIANLFRPWILARLSAASAASMLVIFGLWVALRVLRHFRVASSSEGQLALERRAELCAQVVEVALGATIAGLALAVIGADRMTASIRGAMCAYGVLDASPWGFRAMATSIVASLACALWVAVHRLDLRLASPALTRAKFQALLVVGPLVVADLVAATAYALDLDLRVVASCCSTGLDDAAAIATRGAIGGPRETAAAAFFALGVAAIAIAAFVRRRPSARAAVLVGAASSLAAIAAIPAIVWWVAPHAYESPDHLCPFCLLHADVLGIGWPLFGALFVATALGGSIGLIGALERASGEPEVARAMARRLSAPAIAAWSATLALALAPIARWWIVAGGASLFGNG